MNDPGLCATCTHSRIVESAKQSRFWLCRLSETNPRFAKYPRLPVLACPGYEELRDIQLQPNAGGHLCNH